MPDGAEPVEGTPKRRRRSEAARPAAEEVETLAEVCVDCLLLVADESTHEAEVRGRGSRGAAKKAVCNLLVADATGMAQVTLWAEVAKRVLPLAQQWLEQAPDGRFPEIRLTGMQVSAYRSKTVPPLMRLQSTARSKVEAQGAPATVIVRPPPAMLLQNTRVLREPNVMTCVRGVVQNLTAMSFSQEDVPMRGFDLVTDDQWKVPTKLHGPVAEEEGLQE
ncbi:unnamed protein product, partial [Durusdinium trenchii]